LTRGPKTTPIVVTATIKVARLNCQNRRRLGIDTVGLGAKFFSIYLACQFRTLGVPRGADFMRVFRFVSTAGLLVFLSAIVQHAIWFKCRITGHVIESIGYAAIIGATFGALWPA
jgi:hypothetical protein